MGSYLLFLFATALLGCSGALVAAALRIREVIGFILAAYLVSYSELVVVIAVLSAARVVTQRWLALAISLGFLLSLFLWVVCGKPPVPSARGPFRALRRVLHDPALAVLFAVFILALAYELALALWTPANSWDAMWYHLARAAFWNQQHGVGFIPNAQDTILDPYPPVAEIGHLYTMAVASTDRFVTLIALSSFCITTVAVFGIARRLQLETRAALLSALLFATLPVVLMQASGALIDLVVAGFLCSCTYFLLGRRHSEIWVAALGLALAAGTKWTAVLALPLIAGIAALAQPRRRWIGLGLVGFMAIAVGSVWSIMTRFETGALDGHLAGRFDQVANHSPLPVLASIVRLLIDFAELPGAFDWRAVFYVVAAVAVAALAFVERDVGRRIGVAVGAALVALAPLTILGLAPFAKRSYQWLFFHLGRGDLGVLDQDRGFLGGSALVSFYGPIGLMLVLLSVVTPVFLLRRRLPPLMAWCAAAPLVYTLTIGITLAYTSRWGRFFMFPVALGVVVAGGLAARSRALTWGLVAVASTTAVLTLLANDEKQPAVWGQPRSRVQTTVGPGRNNGERQAILFAQESIPETAHVGLAITWLDWSYPFFGSRLRRIVRLVPVKSAPTSDLGWLVVAPTRGSPGAGWAKVLQTKDGWRVFARS